MERVLADSLLVIFMVSRRVGRVVRVVATAFCALHTLHAPRCGRVAAAIWDRRFFWNLGHRGDSGGV